MAIKSRQNRPHRLLPIIALHGGFSREAQAFSFWSLPDGQTKTMPPASFPIQLWNVADDESAGCAEVAGTNANGTVISPDGRFVAVAVIDENRPRVELLTVPSLTCAKQIDLPMAVNAVEFSASGKLLAASVNDGTILVWDLGSC